MSKECVAVFIELYKGAIIFYQEGASVRKLTVVIYVHWILGIFSDL